MGIHLSSANESGKALTFRAAKLRATEVWRDLESKLKLAQRKLDMRDEGSVTGE